MNIYGRDLIAGDYLKNNILSDYCDGTYFHYNISTGREILDNFVLFIRWNIPSIAFSPDLIKKKRSKINFVKNNINQFFLSFKGQVIINVTQSILHFGSTICSLFSDLFCIVFCLPIFTFRDESKYIKLDYLLYGRSSFGR